MGSEISALRNALDTSDAEREKMEERLNILEKMVNYHLENAKISMLNGERSDQQIHTGTVVEFSKQVNISVSKEASTELQDAIKDFFGGTKTLKDGFEKLVIGAVGAILGNTSMGEHEGSSMFIQWSDNALLRLDAYYYRWNFSSDEVIKDVEGASGVIVMTRVINLVKTDPQVLTWAISRQAELLDPPGDAPKMIDDAVAVIKKVSALQQAVNSIENEEQSKGMGDKSD